MRELIAEELRGDGTLGALLTGGIHTAPEISRQGTPAAFDANGEIRPCGLVGLETETPAGPHENSTRLFFTFTVYERAGYAAIDAALGRAFSLLHRAKIVGTLGDGSPCRVWEVRHVEDSPDVADQGLGCAMKYGRYVVVRAR